MYGKQPVLATFSCFTFILFYLAMIANSFWLFINCLAENSVCVCDLKGKTGIYSQY